MPRERRPRGWDIRRIGPRAFRALVDWIRELAIRRWPWHDHRTIRADLLHQDGPYSRLVHDDIPGSYWKGPAYPPFASRTVSDLEPVLPVAAVVRSEGNPERIFNPSDLQWELHRRVDGELLAKAPFAYVPATMGNSGTLVVDFSSRTVVVR